jgi:hypothetical protein
MRQARFHWPSGGTSFDRAGVNRAADGEIQRCGEGSRPDAFADETNAIWNI